MPRSLQTCLLFIWVGIFSHLSGADVDLFKAVEQDEFFRDLLASFRSTASSSSSSSTAHEACVFYQYAAQRGEGRAANTALWRLSELARQEVCLGDRSAWDWLVAAADAGNEEAQHRLSIAYSVGVYDGALVPMDAGKGLALEAMAALSGDPEAALGMGYRFLKGVGVTESCERALPFYEFAAHLAADAIAERGYPEVIDTTHLSALEDPASQWVRSEATQELVDYYAALALDGDGVAAGLLGNLYLGGSRLVPVNQSRAVFFLHRAYRLQNVNVAGTLALLLLRRRHRYSLFFRAEDWDAAGQDSEGLRQLLRLAAKKNQPAGLVALGYAHMHGLLGMDVNATLSREYFASALPNHPDAGFLLGELLLGRSPAVEQEEGSGMGSPIRQETIAAAMQAYSSSAAMGNVLASHRLAVLLKGRAPPPLASPSSSACEAAVSYFKIVAERGDWAQGLNIAHEHFREGRALQALDLFARYAAVGFESAQFNAAHLLHLFAASPSPSNSLRLLQVSPHGQPNASSVARLSPSQVQEIAALLNSTPSNETISPREVEEGSSDQTLAWECQWRGLALYALSAAQGQAESLMLLGDYYYYGHAQLDPSPVRALTYYQEAAHFKHSQATFNLGLMHAWGDGVPRDIHLAKRYYDQAAGFDAHARLPRDLALWLLALQQRWDSWRASSTLAAAVAAWMEDIFAAIKSADQELQHWLDEIARRCSPSSSPAAQAVGREAPAVALGKQLRARLQAVQMKFVEHVNAFAEGREVERKWRLTAAEEVALLALLCAWLILLLLIRFYT
eukprot:gene7936-8755_t